MTESNLRDLVFRHTRGELTPAEFEDLQARLRSDPDARAVFRECMDLEAGLRTWASERRPVRDRPRIWRVRNPRAIALAALAASVLLLAGIWTLPRGDEPTEVLGRMLESPECVWADTAARGSDGEFATGPLALDEGVVELRFDSGSELVIEGPCELHVVAANTARLIEGRVTVRVNDVADGFVLETPEARILDEGTEYAVSLGEETAEVHVFEGAVLWSAAAGADERIPAGEARRYSRSRPGRGARIPLDARQFVRRLEERVRSSSDGMLIAYDGFEYLAGRLRRGRHGFGWSDGWRSENRGRGRLGTVVNSPDDRVFGIERKGRRQLRLEDGDAIRRELESPLQLGAEAVFLSSLLTRLDGEPTTDRSFEISLVDGTDGPGPRSRSRIAFGIDGEGRAFTRNGRKTARSDVTVEAGATCLLVVRIVEGEAGSIEVTLRLYAANETLPPNPPDQWTITNVSVPDSKLVSSVRMAVMPGATFDLDELRIGRTWESVTRPPGGGR